MGKNHYKQVENQKNNSWKSKLKSEFYEVIKMAVATDDFCIRYRQHDIKFNCNFNRKIRAVTEKNLLAEKEKTGCRYIAETQACL